MAKKKAVTNVTTEVVALPKDISNVQADNTKLDLGVSRADILHLMQSEMVAEANKEYSIAQKVYEKRLEELTKDARKLAQAAFFDYAKGIYEFFSTTDEYINNCIAVDISADRTDIRINLDTMISKSRYNDSGHYIVIPKNSIPKSILNVQKEIISQQEIYAQAGNKYRNTIEMSKNLKTELVKSTLAATESGKALLGSLNEMRKAIKEQLVQNEIQQKEQFQLALKASTSAK